MADALGRCDVDRVLIAKGPLLHAQDEAELFDVLRQVREGKGDAPVFLEIVQLKRLKVAQQEMARQVSILEARKVGECLGLGLCQIAADALLLNQQHPFPKQVDKAVPIAEQCDGFLKRGHPAHGHAKDLKKVAVEKLSLPLFVPGVLPFLREPGGAGADFIPR